MSSESLFFRFAAALALATAVGLVAVAIEKQMLVLKRAISLQHYEFANLREQRSRLRFHTEKQKAPARLLQRWSEEHLTEATSR